MTQLVRCLVAKGADYMPSGSVYERIKIAAC